MRQGSRGPGQERGVGIGGRVAWTSCGEDQWGKAVVSPVSEGRMEEAREKKGIEGNIGSMGPSIRF